MSLTLADDSERSGGEKNDIICAAAYIITIEKYRRQRDGHRGKWVIIMGLKRES